MRRRVNRTQLPVVAVMAAALALTGCGLLDEQAETTTDVGEEEADRLAQLEEELRELRDSQDSDEEATPVQEGATEAAAESEGAESETPDEESETISTSDVVEARVFEVDETQTNDVGDLEVTVERVIVHDYHVEVELTAVNDHPEDARRLWMDRNTNRPQLFDEQDRRFAYQHPAGYNTGDSVTLEPGQRLDAVMAFGGRLHPDAETLTLRFLALQLEGWEWVVDLEEAER